MQIKNFSVTAKSSVGHHCARLWECFPFLILTTDYSNHWPKTRLSSACEIWGNLAGMKERGSFYLIVFLPSKHTQHLTFSYHYKTLLQAYSETRFIFSGQPRFQRPPWGIWGEGLPRASCKLLEPSRLWISCCSFFLSLVSPANLQAKACLGSQGGRLTEVYLFGKNLHLIWADYMQNSELKTEVPSY